MNRSGSARRRHRVVMRPQARARRTRAAAAVLAVGLLGVVAVSAVRHAAGSFSRPRFLAPSARGADQSVLVDVASEPLRVLAQAAADAVSGSAAEKAAAVKAKFSCVADVTVRRPWGEGRTTIFLALRRATAAVRRRGRPDAVLGEDGVVFEAPAGVYSLSGPAVELDGAGEDERRALAREWPRLSASGAFPAELLLMSYRSAEDGWEARLDDGTTVLWGRLEWTKQKLERLSQALADAKAKEEGNFSADLRYFEDGKVLLKPRALPAGLRGGVR